MRQRYGRRVPFIYTAFALSLLLHGLLLLWQVQGASKFVSLNLAARARSAMPLEARLLMPQGGHKRVFEPRQSPGKSETPPRLLLQPATPESTSAASKRAPARPAAPAGAAAPADRLAQSSTVVKIVNLHSGESWSFDRWQGVVTEGAPVRVMLTINPAGFVDRWEFLSEVPEAFKNQLALISVMIRNMEPDKTGETHARVWESELGKKDGNWVAKIYTVEP